MKLEIEEPWEGTHKIENPSIIRRTALTAAYPMGSVEVGIVQARKRKWSWKSEVKP